MSTLQVIANAVASLTKRVRQLEVREYAEVVGPGSVINAQYLTLALHAILTAERRFVDGDGLVGTDAGANADYTLDVDLVAAWSGLEFAAGELRVDLDAAFTWAGVHTFNANIDMGAGVTIDGMDPSVHIADSDAHHNENHVLLSAPHTDTLAAAVVDGDVIIGNVTPRWSRLAIAVPAANVRNVLGIDNAELRPSWKTALDNVNPADIAGAAAPGTSLIFSHRDHVHNHPAGLGVDLHHNEVHVVNSTGPHAEAGLTIGHVLRVSGAAAFSFAALQAGDIPGLGGVPALTFGLANAAGAAATYIQTDASIAIFDAVVPGTIQCDDAANTGAAAFAARRDHQHEIICAIAVDIANANAEGTEYTFARSDHVHNHPAALGANLHHTQIHNVVGGDHTLTGAQWVLVGATAVNTIGLLTPSAAPGAAEAILKSTAAGALTLVDLTLTNDLLLADGAVIGITGNEIITFNAAAGTIVVSGADLHIDSNAPQLLFNDLNATNPDPAQFLLDASIFTIFSGRTDGVKNNLVLRTGDLIGSSAARITIAGATGHVTIAQGLNVGTATGAGTGEILGKVASGNPRIKIETDDGIAIIGIDGGGATGFSRIQFRDDGAGQWRIDHDHSDSELHVYDDVNNINVMTFALAGAITAHYGLNVGTATGATVGMGLFSGFVGSGIATAISSFHAARPNTSAKIELERIDTSVATGNDIGAVNVRGGHDTITTVGRFLVEADQNWTNTASGTRIVLSVIAQDTLVLTEAVRIDDGLVATFAACLADGTCEIFTEDALGIIKDIHTHGTEEYDEYGHEHFDMPWMFDKYPFLIHKNEVGYYDKLGAKSDLLYRAAIQLDDYRLTADAEREAIREQIGIMQNRLAVLEQAA